MTIIDLYIFNFLPTMEIEEIKESFDIEELVEMKQRLLELITAIEEMFESIEGRVAEAYELYNNSLLKLNKAMQ